MQTTNQTQTQATSTVLIGLYAVLFVVNAVIAAYVLTV